MRFDSSQIVSGKPGAIQFGMGSRAPIAISLLVKNTTAKEHGKIHFHDIGDYLGREEKLEKIESYASIAGITKAGGWQPVIPDAHGDWLKQRDVGFSQYIVLGNKDDKQAMSLFANYSNGVKTQRDAWCYNASKESVAANMARMITFYNSEVQRFNAAMPGLDKKAREEAVDSFINTNPAQISWTRALKQELTKDRPFAYATKSLTLSLYRPFTKQWLYFNRRFNEMVYQMPRIFPDAAVENYVIAITAIGTRNGFSCLISGNIIDLNSMEAGAQCFPLYLYDPVVPAQAGTQSMLDWGEAKPLDSRLRGNDGYMSGNDEREGFWRVEKMKVPKTDGKKDLTRLIYNAHITVSGIPPEAYDYVVNGKPALDWVIERQCVKTDKDSGIKNDANDWAIETMGNPRYPLELFLRVITVSLETMKIVNSLPPLEILAA